MSAPAAGAAGSLAGGRAVLVVEHEPGCALGRLAAPLAGALPPGTALRVVRPWRGEALPAGPGALDGLAGLVVLGGQVAAWEDNAAPWLPATRALLAAAARSGAGGGAAGGAAGGAGVPVLGVCLGAQLLALATGGRVERGAAGQEAGLVEVVAAPAAAGDALLGPVVAALGERFAAPQAHGDAVVELPPDAELLASSARYPVQALRVGERAWGVQYHPEVDAGSWAAWMDDAAPALAADGSSPAAQVAAAAAAQDHLAELARQHATAFAAAVRDRAPSVGAGRAAGADRR